MKKRLLFKIKQIRLLSVLLALTLLLVVAPQLTLTTRAADTYLIKELGMSLCIEK